MSAERRAKTAAATVGCDELVDVEKVRNRVQVRQRTNYRESVSLRLIIRLLIIIESARVNIRLLLVPL
jgi:hypothetical protein